MKKTVVTLAKIGASIITNIFITPKAPGFASVITEATNIAADKLSHIKNRDLSLDEIKDVCRVYMENYPEDQIEITSTAVHICLKNIMIFTQPFDTETLANKLSSDYLTKFCRHYSSAEISFLGKYLPYILKNIILSIQIQLESDSNFQVAWKSAVDNRLRQLESNQQFLFDTMEDHEKRIRDQENRTFFLHSRIADLYFQYKEKWQDSLFLDNEVSLFDIYQLPHYDNECINLHDRLQSVFYSCNDINRRMLVILGHPGSGKSTLITYILNKCNIAEDRSIRVFRFSAFENVDWNGNLENLPHLMLNEMGLHRQDLNNSVLILDGLDEIDMYGRHAELLEVFFKQWAKSVNIERFNLIITCRANRIESPELLTTKHISLCPLDHYQTQTFIDKYYEKKSSVKDKINVSSFLHVFDTTREVLGIPLILYMALSLNINVKKESHLCDIYDQIFSLNNSNSIYFRKKYDNEHPITSNEAEIIHFFSKQIAEKIWELSPSEATLSQDVYFPLADKIASPNKDEFRKVLIGQYFIEGKDGCELFFVHRSMYEYFVALSIFDSICDVINSFKTPLEMYNSIHENNFARIIGLQNLSSYPDIQEYLRFLMKKSPMADESWWKNILEGFIEHGMCDLVPERRKGGRQGIQEEVNRFYNLLWIVREQLLLRGATSPIVVNSDICSAPYFQIPYDSQCDLSKLNLYNIDLMGKHFNESCFDECYLVSANFSRTSLEFASFINCNMNDAIFEKASMYGATLDYSSAQNTSFQDANMSITSLNHANFSGADLRGVNFEDADLNYADFTGANLAGAIFTNTLFENTIFKRANFEGSTFSNITLNNCDFSDATMDSISFSNVSCLDSIFTGAKLSKIQIENSDFSNSNFSSADFKEANIYEGCFRNCIFNGSNLDKANLDSSIFNSAIFTKSSLENITAENAYFYGASLTDVDLRGASLTNANFCGAKLSNVTVNPDFQSSIICNQQDFESWEILEAEVPFYTTTNLLISSEFDCWPQVEFEDSFDIRRILDEYGNNYFQ